jgi:choline-sulfatase
MIFAAVLCGVASALIFRAFAARGVTRTIDRIMAHLMELRLFIDEPAVVMKAQRDLVRENIRLMGQIAVPCLVAALLYGVVIAEFGGTWGRGPLRAGEPAVVTERSTGSGDPQIEARPEIVVETPGIRVPAAHEVSWRIRPLRAFSGDLSARTPDGRRISLAIPFPRAKIFGVDWLIWFFGISLVVAPVALRIVKWKPAAIALTLALVPPGARAADTPVIIISIDTLRADHLSSWGYTKLRTPNIDSFAEHGTIYRQIDSQIPLTLPSHTVLMTSQYPFATGVESNDAKVPPGTLTLASILRSSGYATAAFTGSMVLNRSYGLDRGFDFYDSPFEGAAASAPNLYSARVRRDGALVTRAARQWMETNRGRPIFAFLHFFDLHTPYPLPGMAGMRSNTAGYDAQLRHVDELLGSFREWLTSKGWWDRSLVIVLGDHGESLGDHGETSHGYFTYESTLHVPLIVHWPADSGPHPAPVDENGGLIDVAPTVLDFLHIPAPASFMGTSLLHTGAAPRVVFSESMYPHDVFGWAALRSIRQGAYKYIDAPRAEFYDLGRDPAEHTNTLDVHRQQAGALKATLGHMIAQQPQAAHSGQTAPHPDGTRTRELLQSLGYTAGTAAASSNADPKDRIAEAEAYENSLALLYTGDFAGAIRGFTSITASDERNLAAVCALGDAYFRSGDEKRALEMWQKALDRDPHYRPATESIGQYWLARRDYVKACKLLPDAPQCRQR